MPVLRGGASVARNLLKSIRHLFQRRPFASDSSSDGQKAILAPPRPHEENAEGTKLLLIALTVCVLFHGGLLPFTHANTYDAFIHMFFGDSYHRSWFDPWDPRWYAGFSTTSYPPGTHMAIGTLMYVMPVRAAFVVVQLTGVLLLTVGVYRFALLWVPPRASGYAALALVMSSSISETIHLFGQLPTIFSLGIFLNGMPYVYRWIAVGKWPNFFAAVIFGMATTSAHHVTTLFGAVLFIIPLSLHALFGVALQSPFAIPRSSRSRPRDALVYIFRSNAQRAVRWQFITRFARPVGRGLLLGAALIAAIVVTIFPYWYWSITDPITQVSIPHGSRESFINRTDLGFVFFILPWGASLLFLPYALYKAFRTRLWPLGATLLLCAILGTGGTTTIPRTILRGAFDILTLDRFTFWATILILPFLGLMVDGLLHGRSRQAITQAFGRNLHRICVMGLFATYVGIAVFCAVLPVMRPTQPDFIDPDPIVAFLSQDEHDRWRYMTLGFGDQFAYLSSLTTAQSVDGNYHSARRLPEMMSYSMERLENAKYLGVPGLGSLQQFLVNTDRYHLKYIFSNDAFYDPVLLFSGWNRLNRLENGVSVWEKPDVAPLPLLLPRRDLSRVQTLMWGVLPPLALLAAAATLLTAATRRSFTRHQREYRPLLEAKQSFANPALVRKIVIGLGVLLVLSVLGLAGYLARDAMRERPPEQVVEDYMNHLDFRRFQKAYDLLDPKTRASFDDVRFQWRWRGGLIASYGKLVGMETKILRQTAKITDLEVTLDWLTALDTRTEVLQVRMVRRDDGWYVLPSLLRPVQTPVRIQRDPAVDWNVTGRRQPRPDSDLHRDKMDRPRIAVSGARLVKKGNRYSLVGEVTNVDADPAHLTLHSDLRSADKTLLIRQAASTISGQRILPAETTGFRIAYEGVLSLTYERALGNYDPKLFIPPELAATPATATMDARALVTGANLYRGIALNGMSFTETPKGLEIKGLAVNVGTEIASVIRVVMLGYDMQGRPLWADVGYVDANIMPGQSEPFRMYLSKASDVTVISEVPTEDTLINGSAPQDHKNLPNAQQGTIPLSGLAGYSAIRLHVTDMIYDPEF